MLLAFAQATCGVTLPAETATISPSENGFQCAWMNGALAISVTA